MPIARRPSAEITSVNLPLSSSLRHTASPSLAGRSSRRPRSSRLLSTSDCVPSLEAERGWNWQHLAAVAGSSRRENDALGIGKFVVNHLALLGQWLRIGALH
jgi:hypothetical protein